MDASKEKKVDISISYQELEKAIKSVPLRDISQIIDIDDIIDGFSASEILSCIDDDKIVDYVLYEDLLPNDEVLENIPIHGLISYIKGQIGLEDFADETVESADDSIKAMKNFVKKFNYTTVYTKEDLKKGVCELIDNYYI
jgi:hypothetical protein